MSQKLCLRSLWNVIGSSDVDASARFDVLAWREQPQRFRSADRSYRTLVLIVAAPFLFSSRMFFPARYQD